MFQTKAIVDELLWFQNAEYAFARDAEIMNVLDNIAYHDDNRKAEDDELYRYGDAENNDENNDNRGDDVDVGNNIRLMNLFDFACVGPVVCPCWITVLLIRNCHFEPSMF